MLRYDLRVNGENDVGEVGLSHTSQIPIVDRNGPVRELPVTRRAGGPLGGSVGFPDPWVNSAWRLVARRTTCPGWDR